MTTDTTEHPPLRDLWAKHVSRWPFQFALEMNQRTWSSYRRDVQVPWRDRDEEWENDLDTAGGHNASNYVEDAQRGLGPPESDYAHMLATRTKAAFELAAGAQYRWWDQEYDVDYQCVDGLGKTWIGIVPEGATRRPNAYRRYRESPLVVEGGAHEFTFNGYTPPPGHGWRLGQDELQAVVADDRWSKCALSGVPLMRVYEDADDGTQPPHKTSLYEYDLVTDADVAWARERLDAWDLRRQAGTD